MEEGGKEKDLIMVSKDSQDTNLEDVEISFWETRNNHPKKTFSRTAKSLSLYDNYIDLVSINDIFHIRIFSHRIKNGCQYYEEIFINKHGEETKFSLSDSSGEFLYSYQDLSNEEITPDWLILEINENLVSPCVYEETRKGYICFTEIENILYGFNGWNIN